jgi:hypothetical protein
MNLRHNPVINSHVYNNGYETNKNIEDNFDDLYELTHPSIITKYPSKYIPHHNTSIQRKIPKALLPLELPGVRNRFHDSPLQP